MSKVMSKILTHKGIGTKTRDNLTLATTLVCAIIEPTSRPGVLRAHVVAVGDSSAWVLTAGQFIEVLGGKTTLDDGVASSAVSALPRVPTHLADHARAAHRHPGDLAAAHRHDQWEAVLPPRCRDPGGLPRLRLVTRWLADGTTCGNPSAARTAARAGCACPPPRAACAECAAGSRPRDFR